jgi:hypothetical protein
VRHHDKVFFFLWLPFFVAALCLAGVQWAGADIHDWFMGIATGAILPGIFFPAKER